MKVLILNTDYPKFLQWLYQRRAGLEREPYEEQLRVRMESMFGVADFYSSNLRKLGHEAWDVHANNEFLQRAWAREHGLFPGTTRSLRQRASKLGAPVLRFGGLRYLARVVRSFSKSARSQPRWFYEILAAQIKHYRPDILLNQAMESLSGEFLREMKPYLRLLVGQHAAPLPRGADLGCYDLLLSSLPNFVAFFRGLGLPAELYRLAFEPRLLARLTDGGAAIPVSFVGSLSGNHQSRIKLLEYLCSHTTLNVWGPGIDQLPNYSPIRSRYMGEAWALEMYQILKDSKITLNHHIGVAGPYANNFRLFESTGVGCLVVTDWKTNLADLFEAGKEVVAYRSPEECLDLVRYYLVHETERKLIGLQGQRRTLQEHTFYHRAEELAEICASYL